jgi:hypothetical protein
MSLATTYESPAATIIRPLAPWFNLLAGPARQEYSAKMLHCTAQNPDGPDPRYWTAYDHFMARLEAKAQRRRARWRMAAAWVDRFMRWTRTTRSAPRGGRGVAPRGRERCVMPL